MNHYTDIQQVLTGERSLVDASEAHGTLAGCLCAALEYRFEDWLQEILPEGQAEPRAQAALREVFAETATALEDPDTAFDLLLPAGSQPLEARATALGQWCQGFLYGLGSTDAGTWPGKVGKLVRNFTEITRVGVEDEGSEDESAYAVVVEYVRDGVKEVFAALQPLRGRRGPPPSAPVLH
jgi:uncharacterized protein YgfB (UPF0149 family)